MLKNNLGRITIVFLHLCCLSAFGAGPSNDFLQRPVRMGGKYFGSVKILVNAYSWGKSHWVEKKDAWVYVMESNGLTLEFFMKEHDGDVLIESIKINGKEKQFEEEVAQSFIKAAISSFEGVFE